jgi:hypothetical protein
VDCPCDIRVCLCKEVCENVAGVLGFNHFGVNSVAYLGGLRYKIIWDYANIV